MEQNSCQTLWSNCLKVIKDNVSENSFKTWFEPIIPVKLEKNILTIQVPSTFFYEYLEEKYIDILKKTLRRELGNDAMLEYNIVMDNDSEENKPYTVKYPGRSASVAKNKPVNMPLSEEQPVMNPFVLPGIKKLNIDPRLNPNYSFSNFIEGECNRLARSAGSAVADHPGGTAFNPLMIFGDSGLGKTHLVHAIGLATKEKFPEKNVLYVNAHIFQTQFAEATRNNNRNNFLYYYQMIDMLIIDDVHEFCGKEKTQDIFFHIFNHLHQSGKQLILTSDKAPADLQGMEQRLLSRFKWGLAADLKAPDFETRVAILRNKCYMDGIQVSDDVLEYIAANITSSIRELEGALISTLAQALNHKTISIEVAKEVVDKISRNVKKEITIDYISKVVCNYFNITPDQLSVNTRKREIVLARQVAMYFSKLLTKSSLTTIGTNIGKKDHATVLHAYKTVLNLRDTDKMFKRQLEDIERKLKAV
ncbi:MAG TPA: chromosomal replication initiator protein DnaA [Bacteroidales bacterium]|nr:chromosomal replication initiator protein DnaA [Bacteroidales bacterium]